MKKIGVLAILLLPLSWAGLGQNLAIAPAVGVLEEHIELVLRSASGDEISLHAMRYMSNRSLPFFVEYKIDGGSDLQLSWDFNQLEDSDCDGQFRNDQDAVGLSAWYIYDTNREPYQIAMRAQDASGTEYVGEDMLTFNLQAGDRILLGMVGPQAAEGELKFTAWACDSGDPLDENWAIHTDGSQRWLAPQYPGIAEAHALIEGSPFSTLVYVFNPSPELLSKRGINFTRTGFGHIDLGYIDAVYRELQSRGFNWVNIPYTWLYSRSRSEYHIYPTEDFPTGHPTDEKLIAVTDVGHSLGLNISWSLGLQEAEDTAEPTQRTQIWASDGFFDGEYGYSAFGLHAAALAKQAEPEMIMAFVEMGGLQWPGAEAYLTTFYGELRAALPSSTTMSTSNLIFGGTTPDVRPHPYLNTYATPYQLLDSVGFSSYMSVADNCDASIAEMKSAFEAQQLDILAKVRAGPGEDTELFISEYGVSAFDCAAACFGIGEDWCPETRQRDDEEQRRAVAAALRAMYDFAGQGNTWFSGILWWEWMLDTDEGLASWNRTDMNLNWRPALDEITAFFLDSPHELEQVPIFTPYKWWKVYFDPMQEVISIRSLPQANRVIQAFSSTASADIEVDQYEATGSLLASVVSGSDGNSILALDYENKVGRGGETLADVPVLRSWTHDDGLWIRLKRSTDRIGVALLLFDEQETLSYSLRLPLREVGEWEEVGVLLESATKNLSSGDATFSTSSIPWLAENRMAIYLYSLDGGPVSGRVWVDEIRSFEVNE